MYVYVYVYIYIYIYIYICTQGNPATLPPLPMRPSAPGQLSHSCHILPFQPIL